MPNRHFLRSDYLHIVLYMKFLLFCCLAQKEISDFCWKEKGILQKIMTFNQRTINSKRFRQKK